MQTTNIRASNCFSVKSSMRISAPMRKARRLFRQIGKCLREIDSMEKRRVNWFIMNIWTGMTINLLDNIMAKGKRDVSGSQRGNDFMGSMNSLKRIGWIKNFLIDKMKIRATVYASECFYGRKDGTASDFHFL